MNMYLFCLKCVELKYFAYYIKKPTKSILNLINSDKMITKESIFEVDTRS